MARTAQEAAKMQVRLAERFNERQRIARDLHDTLFQGMQGVLLHVHNASKSLPVNDPTRHSLENTLRKSDSVMLQGRELLLNLRTTVADAKELPERLRASAVDFAHLHPAEFDLVVAGEAVPLEPTVCEELAKLGREAICNAYQHADASKIVAELVYGVGSLHLKVTDDGVGVPSDILIKGGIQNHWGLPGMKERAAAVGASFDITSVTGHGTTVSAVIPGGLAYRHYSQSARRPFLLRLFG